jgi:hypothetical protein
MFTETDPSKLAAAIEQLEAEKRRRIDEKVERGEAIREPLVAGCGGVEDAADALELVKASRIAELRAAGEKREIIFDPIEVMLTGVPRTSRDSKYVERLDREHAKLNAEEIRQREIEAAAARGIDFHEGSKSHEYKPPPLPPRAPETPAELEWRGIIVQVRGPDHERNDPGEIAEARYAVLNSVLYVEDAQGRRLGVHELEIGENAAAVARGIVRKKLGGNQFYRPIAYPNLGLV